MLNSSERQSRVNFQNMNGPRSFLTIILCVIKQDTDLTPIFICLYLHDRTVQVRVHKPYLHFLQPSLPLANPPLRILLAVVPLTLPIVLCRHFLSTCFLFTPPLFSGVILPTNV
ncbi:hypothetical protein CRM22_000822 [Opisthorchis felineus]|uniref:Uncharacterized protein n=1 Tax=Opisthorchis felineus TaxID=147828 RepID=A0A4S2MDB8_OPIFE|nr:hypothetical protein CRM22_000822 [Opisthorchis felineus]